MVYLELVLAAVPCTSAGLSLQKWQGTTRSPSAEPRKGGSRDDILPGTLHSKEDCDHDDPSMSPGSSCSGRGAATLVPAPNGAKVILYCPYLGPDTSRQPGRQRAGQRKNISFFARESNIVPKFKRTGICFVPVAKGRFFYVHSIRKGRFSKEMLKRSQSTRST